VVENRAKSRGSASLDRFGSRGLIVPTTGRPDDTPELIKRKMAIYEHEMTPVINRYRELKRTIEIDADQQPELVCSQIVEKLKKVF